MQSSSFSYNDYWQIIGHNCHLNQSGSLVWCSSLLWVFRLTYNDFSQTEVRSFRNDSSNRNDTWCCDIAERSHTVYPDHTPIYPTFNLFIILWMEQLLHSLGWLKPYQECDKSLSWCFGVRNPSYHHCCWIRSAFRGFLNWWHPLKWMCFFFRENPTKK